jgi:antitoxin (DNA-binding transcriptional repressor) of toxin-antitoxin stability system
MPTYSVTEAKNHLSELIDRALNGEKWSSHAMEGR